MESGQSLAAIPPFLFARMDSEPSDSGAVLIQQGLHFVTKGGEVCFEDACWISKKELADFKVRHR